LRVALTEISEYSLRREGGDRLRQELDSGLIRKERLDLFRRVAAHGERLGAQNIDLRLQLFDGFPTRDLVKDEGREDKPE